MTVVCPVSMAECYRSCGDHPCRATGWEDPWTGKMPAEYYVPPQENPLTTHDHNPPPVSKHPIPASLFNAEGIDMGPAMQEVLDRIARKEPGQQPDPGDGELHVPLDHTKANPKHALGTSKVPLHFVPMSAVVLLALAHEFGGKKYGITNWRDTDVVRSVYLDAMGRHYMALMDGQDLDEESGLPHEAHIMACCAIIVDARELGRLIDDRGTSGNVAAILKRYQKSSGARTSRGYPHDGAR